MRLRQLLAVLGTSVVVFAHPFEEIFPRQAGACQSFVHDCKGQYSSVKTYCTNVVYPATSTVTNVKTKTRSVFTTTTITPPASTSLVTVTSTETDTNTVTTVVTTTLTTGTTLVAPSGCGGAPALVRRATSCLASYTASSQISTACSCVGVTAASTATHVRKTAVTTTIVATRTATNTNPPVLQTTTETTTSTFTATITSTSTVNAFATSTGFALAYNGNYGVGSADAINLSGISGTPAAFTLQDDGTLIGLNGRFKGQTADTFSNSPYGDYVRLSNPQATIPVICQISGSCLLQCTSGDKSLNYLYSRASDSRSGNWVLANGQYPSESAFPGPNVVAYPGTI